MYALLHLSLHIGHMCAWISISDIICSLKCIHLYTHIDIDIKSIHTDIYIKSDIDIYIKSVLPMYMSISLDIYRSHTETDIDSYI